MKLSTVMIANAAFALLGASVLILMPAQMMKPYGVVLDNGGIFLAQLMGTVLVGLSVMYFWGRRLKDKEALRVLSWGAIIVHGGSAVVGVLSFLAHTIGGPIWVDISLHGAFALAFWYYGLGKK